MGLIGAAIWLEEQNGGNKNITQTERKDVFIKLVSNLWDDEQE
jgi:hypothetical protein